MSILPYSAGNCPPSTQTNDAQQQYDLRRLPSYHTRRPSCGGKEWRPTGANSFGNPHSSDHIVGWQAAKAVDQSKTTVAGLLGADPDEIIFTSGATEANNLALFGLARRAPPGQRRILVGATEHKCVLAAARALETRENFTVEQIPVDREGFIDLDALAEGLGETTLVVSIMLVNNEVGTIQDIPRIAEIVNSRGVLLHCDAAQGACALDMSRLADHADLISLSGHKIYGPQGIGALYIRRDLQTRVEPIIYGGGQQSDLRSGTVPVPLCVGMAAAAEILQTDEGATERKRVAGQRDAFVERLQASPYPISLNGPTGDRRHPGNANLRFEGFVAQDLLAGPPTPPRRLHRLRLHLRHPRTLARPPRPRPHPCPIRRLHPLQLRTLHN